MKIIPKSTSHPYGLRYTTNIEEDKTRKKNRLFSWRDQFSSLMLTLTVSNKRPLKSEYEILKKKIASSEEKVESDKTGTEFKNHVFRYSYESH